MRGGCRERVDSWEVIFGLLNFCCTRQACFIWEDFSGSHPLPPPVVTVSAGEGLAATGGGFFFLLSQGGHGPLGNPPS